jgi:hypothetical protein
MGTPRQVRGWCYNDTAAVEEGTECLPGLRSLCSAARQDPYVCGLCYAEHQATLDTAGCNTSALTGFCLPSRLPQSRLGSRRALLSSGSRAVAATVGFATPINSTTSGGCAPPATTGACYQSCGGSCGNCSWCTCVDDVPPRRHQHPGRNSELTEIYLRFLRNRSAEFCAGAGRLGRGAAGRAGGGPLRRPHSGAGYRLLQRGDDGVPAGGERPRPRPPAPRRAPPNADSEPLRIEKPPRRRVSRRPPYPSASRRWLLWRALSTAATPWRRGGLG